MTTGTKIVQRALQKIGVHSPLQPASPEALQVGYEELMNMISEWYDDKIDIGAVPIEDISDDLCESLGTRSAVQNQLAVRLAPEFPGAQISTELDRQAKLTYNKMVRRWKVRVVSKPRVRGTLPVGQGNKFFNSRYSKTFFEEGEELA